MQCRACHGELPSGFPGGAVVCACGVTTKLEDPAGRTSASPSTVPGVGGPYRASSTRASEDLEAQCPCPYCGNGCPPLVRVCPHCDVRLDNVRCVQCYSLQPPGAFGCVRCGHALELEALLDATDAPCPRCRTPLEAAGTLRASASLAPDLDDARTHECPRCGGMFVPRDALAEILCRAELSGPFADPRPMPFRALDEVRYVPCPLCHGSMNRVNFGRVSGVIVDVCRAHGTWFDGGELTRVVAFAAGGGLAKTRARESVEAKEQAKQAAAGHMEFAVQEARGEMEAKLERWRFFLRELFFW